MISRSVLVSSYIKNNLSVSALAKQLGCSENKVNYWLHKYQIPKRSISEAIYKKWNPHGDPFSCKKPKTLKEAILFGLGLGLYWGEGTKRSLSAVKLGNTDPRLIKKFLEFLKYFYKIDNKRLKFGLQIFGDMDEREVKRFWIKNLNLHYNQFYKTTVTPHRGVGNYRTKTKYGVLTINFNNSKLRDILFSAVENMATDKPL